METAPILLEKMKITKHNNFSCPRCNKKMTCWKNPKTAQIVWLCNRCQIGVRQVSGGELPAYKVFPLVDPKSKIAVDAMEYLHNM